MGRRALRHARGRFAPPAPVQHGYPHIGSIELQWARDHVRRDRLALGLLVSSLLLSNNEASFVKNETEKRLLNDNAFLVRGIGSEVFLLGVVAWCSVANGHSAALARWWAVGVIPSICNKWISGDQGGATTNTVIAVISLCLGWAGKAAAPVKRA
jgi:hypothetical protein